MCAPTHTCTEVSERESKRVRRTATINCSASERSIQLRFFRNSFIAADSRGLTIFERPAGRPPRYFWREIKGLIWNFTQFCEFFKMIEWPRVFSQMGYIGGVCFSTSFNRAKNYIYRGFAADCETFFSIFFFFLSSNIIVNFESSHIYDRFSFFFYKIALKSFTGPSSPKILTDAAIKIFQSNYSHQR